MKRAFSFILCLYSACGFGQRPTVTTVDPLNNYPLDRILITGSGFSDNPASLQVWFDQVKGTIVSASTVSIVVSVPPQARLHNVEVVNLESGLSAKSSLKFMPSYSGEGFDPAKMATPLTFPSVNAVFDICSCDLDNDNRPEIIGSKLENVATDLIILRNQSTPGNAVFTAIDKSSLPVLGLNAPTGHITCGDLNGDGLPDLVASRSGTTARSIYVLRNTSAGSPNFAAPVELLLDDGHFARQVAINDLNGDGKPEIIVANSFNNVLYIFVNQSAGGTLSLSPTPVKVVMAGVPNSLALEIQDMDGDDRPDIVLTQNQGPNLYILKNQGAGTISFSAPATIALPGSFNDLSSADFNGDGKLDLVVSSVFNGQAVILLNQSTTSIFSFAASVTLTTGSGPFGVDVSDMDGDGFPDIVIPNRGAPTIDVFIHNRNNASPGFDRRIVTTAKNNWFVRAGDLDGDAKPDIAVSSFTAPATFSVDILRNRNCHLPVILNQPPLTLCTGQTLELTSVASPTATFNWRNGASSIKNSSDRFVEITAAGTYTVTATAEAGSCAVASAPLVVAAGTGTAPATPTINPVTPACSGATLNITTASVPGATYLWDGPNGFAATESDPTLSIANVTPQQAGLYTLRVKVGDCTSNSATREAQVVNLGVFSIASSAAGALCQGQTTTLSVNEVAGHGYQWIRNGGDIGGASSHTLTVSQDGTYRVRVTYTGCSRETAEEIVQVLTPPVADFNTDVASACLGEEVSFTNTSTTDTRATVVYNWLFGDGATADTENAAHTYGVVQDFSPQLTVGYAGVTGCADSQTRNITIGEATPPEITSDVNQLCVGETATLTVTGMYSTLTWNTGQTGTTISVNQPGDYSVTTVDANGCTGLAETTLLIGEGCGQIAVDFPKMFSPNGDTKNDRWVAEGVDNYPDCSMKIFDDKGAVVFSQIGFPEEGWDGVFNGRSIPDGVYFYIFSCPNGKPLTGSVLVVR